MIIKRLCSGLILVATLFASEAARAEEDVATDTYTYGLTCENLGQLSRIELTGITHSLYAEHFANFCKPDSVYRCEDYNSVLVGLGRLEDNGRGSCRYLSEPK